MQENEPPRELEEPVVDGDELRGARRMVQTFFSLAGSELMLRGLMLVAAIIVARILSPGVFGEFTYAVALASIVGFVIDLGLTSLVTRDVSAASHKAPQLLGAFLRTQVLLASAVFTVTAALSMAGLFGDAASKSALIAAFAWVSVMSLSRPFEATLTGRGQASLVFVSRAFRGAVLIVVTALVSLGDPDPTQFILALVASEVVGLIVVATLCLSRSTRPDFSSGAAPVWRMLRLAVPFALLVGFNILYVRVDLLMLGWLDNDVAVGNYGIATRVIDAGVIVPAYFGGAFLATIAQTGPRTALARMQTMSAVKHCLLLCTPLAIALGLAADEIVDLTAGPKYTEAGEILTILSPWLFLVASYSVFANLQVALHHVPLLVKINVVGLLVKILLNTYAIPRFGPNGAAVTSIGTEAMVVVAQLYFARQFFDVGPLLGYLARLLVCALPMIGVGILLLGAVPWMIAVLASICVFALVGLAVRCLSLDEMRVVVASLRARSD